MFTVDELWALAEPVVRAEGLTLFDVELPVRPGGAVRIFVASEADRSPAVSGEPHKKATRVTLDQCAAISRKLSLIASFEEGLPENSVLEVSSPGINRKLRRPEHFKDAVGQRVKVTASTEPKVARGKLLSFDGEKLAIEDELKNVLLTVPLGSVKEARIDFLFE